MTPRLALAALLLVACGRETPPPARDSAALAAPAPSTPLATDSVATAAASASKPRCPATGLWSECAVLERLDRSGLVPRPDSSRARIDGPAMRVRGVRLHVGSSELDLYVYPDTTTRARDEATLDRTKYLPYNAPLTMASQATLIRSVNLLAILHSRNDHLRERVGDALTAGPPQPQRRP